MFSASCRQRNNKYVLQKIEWIYLISEEFVDVSFEVDFAAVDPSDFGSNIDKFC